MNTFLKFFKVFWPLVALTLGGIALLPIVVDSIESTPHPELVYGIFSIFICACCLIFNCVYRFTMEYKIAFKAFGMNQEDRMTFLGRLKFKSDFKEFYHSIVDIKKLPTDLIQSSLENEIDAGSERMFAKLEMPEFLGGSLVGVGLVGTFIGLLATLEDLGGLFSSMDLSSTSGSNTMAVFGDLIKNLQKPLKGMGTAFVASLYGLLGSLIVGLMISSSRHLSEQSLRAIRRLIKQCINEQSLQKKHELENAKSTSGTSIEGVIEPPYYLKLLEGIEVLKNTSLIMAKNQAIFSQNATALQRQSNQLLANAVEQSLVGDDFLPNTQASVNKTASPANTQLSKAKEKSQFKLSKGGNSKYPLIISILLILTLTALALYILYSIQLS